MHPGKTNCLVLDFCDNFHDIQSIATLEKAVSLPSEGTKGDIEGVLGRRKKRALARFLLVNRLSETSICWIDHYSHGFP